jgi:hypothetical protein
MPKRRPEPSKLELAYERMLGNWRPTQAARDAVAALRIVRRRKTRAKNHHATDDGKGLHGL